MTVLKQNIPSSYGMRPDPDVKLLLQAALKDGRYGSNTNRLLNEIVRRFLTPHFAGKRIRAIQERLGLSPVITTDLV